MFNYDVLKNKIFFGKYKCNKKIGKGSFGYVYQGVNILNDSEVAIKIEHKNIKNHLLELESNFLCLLKGFGIPEIKSYGHSGNFYILVEELLGNNLGQIKNIIKNLTLKDISMIAIQIIDRIEYVHSKYIIHRDIKPENFLLGYKNNSTIYIIDFGISRKYKSSRTGKHIRFSITGKLFGTVRYVSYNASRGVEQSRRDDLESIGYMLLYLIKGKLPWQGINIKDSDREKKYLEMLYLKKNIPPEDLCKNLPPEFANYIKYCKNLCFEEDPDYEYLRNLFKNILLKMNQKNDLIFSWTKVNYFSKQNYFKEMNRDKYINLLKRKESSQTRLYKSIQKSLSKDNKNEKKIYESKSELSISNINLDNHKREISEDNIKFSKKNNLLDNSNISKDILSYNSLLAQYNMNINMNIIGLQYDDQILEQNNSKINSLKNKNILLSSNNNYSKNKSSENSKNQIEIKSNDYNNRNIMKKRFDLLINEKKKKNLNLKKKMNASFDSNKNHLKDSNLLVSRISTMNSKEIKNNLNKKIKSTSFEKTRNPNDNNIYISILSKIKKDIDLLKKNKEILINKNSKIINYDLIKNNNIIHKKTNIKSNLNNIENEFSFKNWPLNKGVNPAEININKKIDILKNKQSKDILNNKIQYYNKIKNNKNSPNNKYKINALKRAKINSENINSNLNDLLEKKNNNRKINIIINNNLNSFTKNSQIKKNPEVNKKENYKNFKHSILKSDTNIMINSKNNILNNQIYSNDKLTEKDFKNSNYINKITNNNFQKVNKLINNESKPIFQNYFNSNRKNLCEEKRKAHHNNIFLNKSYIINNSQDRGKIRLLEYRPLYNYIEKNNFLNNYSVKNTHSKINTYKNNESPIKKDNSFLVGRIKVINLKNKIKNKTPTPTKYSTNNNNLTKQNINNYNNKTNLFHKNYNFNYTNFNLNKINSSNDIKSYIIKPSNFKLKGPNKYRIFSKLERKKFKHYFSPQNNRYIEKSNYFNEGLNLDVNRKLSAHSISNRMRNINLSNCNYSNNSMSNTSNNINRINTNSYNLFEQNYI